MTTPQARYREANREKIRERARQRRAADPDGYRKRERQYREARWSEAHPGQVRESGRDRYLTIGGERRTVTEWAALNGIKPDVIRDRLRYGWDAESAVTTSPQLHVQWGSGKHPLYGIWKGMISRCHNPKDPNYERYGGRGITVCGAWRASFWAFIEDIEETIGPRPTPRHSIDRIDNDDGYEPGNVRWATPKQQQRNTRRNRIVSIGGQQRPLAEWAERSGISWATLAGRLDLGWTPEAAIGTPVQPRAADHTFIPPGGEARCRALGFNPSTIYERMRRRGISFEQAISEPPPRRPARQAPAPASAAQPQTPAPAAPLTLFGLSAPPEGTPR